MGTVRASRPRVLVVIPTLNEGAHIQDVLKQLVAELGSSGQDLVVVVDGGSIDDTIERVESIATRHPEVRLIHNPSRIQSSSVNLAVRKFGRAADVLIRCDAHSVYPRAFCDRLLDTLGRTAADAVVLPMDSIGHTCFQRAIAWVSNSPVGTGGSAHRAGRRSGFVDHGHHAAFRIETFRRCGGYNETFTHNEDGEFDCRQRALGAKIYLDADIRLGYHPRSTIRSLWKQYFAYGGGRSRTVLRHPSSLRMRQLAVPLHFVCSVSALAISPWFPLALALPGFYVAVLFGTSLTLAVRHRSLCGLLAGPAAAVMHTAWACGFLGGILARREQRWRSDEAVPLWGDVGPSHT